HIHLRRRAAACTLLLAGAFEDELQGPRPLVVDAHGVRRPVSDDGGVAVTCLIVLQAAEAPTRTHVRLRADFVHDLSVAAVRGTGVDAAARHTAADTSRISEHENGPDALADVPSHHDRQVGELPLPPTVPPDRPSARAPGP